MKYVYISHPYGGKEENKADVERIIRNNVFELNTNVYISSIHAFGFLYDCTNYYDGLDMCLALLEKCDEMWVYGNYENSIGCKAEIQFCIDHNIPYEIMI